MASLDDVRRIALALPETTEDGDEHPSWRVRTKVVVWDRPLRKGDLAHLGEAAPTGTVIAVRTDGLDAKADLVATEGPTVFTTPHFNGYPAVLVDLYRADVGLLEDLITDAWLAQAPKRLAARYLADNG